MESATKPDGVQTVNLGSLAPLVRALAPSEGYNLTALPRVRLLRSDRPLSRTPVLYDPGIVIVCQGSKRGYFGERTYVYDAHQYLAVSVPVPFTMETDASADAPLLALYLHLDFPLAAELMLEIDRHGTGEHQSPASEHDVQSNGCGHALLSATAPAGAGGSRGGRRA